MKILKKSEIVRLKQVEHINNEKEILSEVDCPFLVKLSWPFPLPLSKKLFSFLFQLLTYASSNFEFVLCRYCTFQDEVNLYMVLEYVVGGEIFSHLRQAGRFSNETSLFFAAQLTSAIAYLHERGIVYRDLKPENLLIDRDGNIKITDFGFAKKVEDRFVSLTWKQNKIIVV